MPIALFSSTVSPLVVRGVVMVSVFCSLATSPLSLYEVVTVLFSGQSIVEHEVMANTIKMTLISFRIVWFFLSGNRSYQGWNG